MNGKDTLCDESNKIWVFLFLNRSLITHFSQERAKLRENMNYVMHANEFHFEEYSAGNK